MEKFKVLLIDDKKENIYSLRMLIEDSFDEIEIFEALSVDDALVLMMKHNINLIFSDVRMPDKDGFDLINYLNDMEQTKDIPVVLISAEYFDKEYIQKGYALGASDYICKPIDAELFCSKLKKYLETYEKEILEENEISEKDRLLFEQIKINTMIENLSKYDKDLSKYDYFLNKEENIDYEQLMKDKKQIDSLMQ